MNSNDNSNYIKKFQFNNNEGNYYVLSLKSLLKDNQEKLEIKLTYINKENIIHYYCEKTLSEIINEYKNLNSFSNIRELTEYLSALVKKKKKKIKKRSEFAFDIIYKDKNINFKFTLIREIDMREKKLLKKIENELVKTYKMVDNLQSQINTCNSKINEVESKYRLFSEKIEQSEKNSNLKSNSIIQKGENNNKSSIIYESQSIYQSYDSLGQSNYKIENLKHSVIYKENNCEILFKKNPKLINKEIPIMEDSNSNEECEFFTAFNAGVQNAIIVWITKFENKSIFIENWSSKKINKMKNAHKAKINILQYFHNDNIKTNNNNYIISLSHNDKETLKIWEVDLININLKLFKVINEKIICFCLFSCELYCKDNNYLISYKKLNNNKNIYFCKLDNDCNILEEDKEWPLIINSSNEVNYLDFYYKRENNEIYLIICNNKDIKVIYQPFIDNNNKEIKIFKKSSSHLSAFITEKIGNSIKLIDSNMEGVFIWNYYNNEEPETIFPIGATFDICLWRDGELWASTLEGFKLIDIEENEVIHSIDEDNMRIRNGSKIRKINSPEENESLIAINSKRKLCLYTY